MTVPDERCEPPGLIARRSFKRRHDLLLPHAQGKPKVKRQCTGHSPAPKRPPATPWQNQRKATRHAARQPRRPITDKARTGG